MAKTIVILGAMDTKHEEISFVKRLIEQAGCKAIILDFSVGHRPVIAGDVTCDEVARAGGGNIAEMWGNPDRVAINRIITDGATRIVQSLRASGGLDGVMCIGGAGGTLIGTEIMQALPFGVPKLVVSSNAAARGFAERYFGTRDITMMHTVVDIAGISDMLETLLVQAAGAMCGMVSAAAGRGSAARSKPSVALCELMMEADHVRYLRLSLEQRGYQVTVFMATGVGDTAMEEVIGEGLFDAVVDLSPGGIIDGLVGGTRAACPNRLETAGQKGIPQIIAPGGLDFIAPPKSRHKPEYDARRRYEPDAARRLLRSNAEELKQAARAIADKLNKAKGPVKFLIPLKGWSAISGPGRPLHDPEADMAFIKELRQDLKPAIEVVEIDARIDEPAFAASVGDLLDEMVKRREVHA